MRHNTQSYRSLTALAACAALAACSTDSPFDNTEQLRLAVERAQSQYTPANPAAASTITLTQDEPDLDFPEDRMKELEEMAGPKAYPQDISLQTPDLTGEANPTRAITLTEVIASAVENNLDVEFARFQPAIARQDVIRADAAFDWTLFADYTFSKTDTPNTVPIINGAPVGAPANSRTVNQYTVGLTQRNTLGGQFTVSQQQVNTDDTSDQVNFAPDPSNAINLVLGYDQPLLRGFGQSVNLAEVSLAENTAADAAYQLKSTLINTVTNAETAYYDLVFAEQSLRINKRLLERGIETRDVLQSRANFDARPAELSDAVARVESRRADVIRAERDLRKASDRLKQIINQNNPTVADETLLLPDPLAADEPITYALVDSITTALAHRPEVARALLNIDNAAIRQTVADNALLPILDLGLQMNFLGLDESVGEAYQDVFESNFVDYLVTLQFEHPLGNRFAEAGAEQARLNRARSATDYRRVVQLVVLDVKTALRDADAAYRLIQQTRTARLAAAENLRTLLVQERLIQSLTPDFLDLKFSRQEALARAEIEEAAAIVDYNSAVSRLNSATGTSLIRNNIDFQDPDGAPRALTERN